MMSARGFCGEDGDREDSRTVTMQEFGLLQMMENVFDLRFLLAAAGMVAAIAQINFRNDSMFANPHSRAFADDAPLPAFPAALGGPNPGASQCTTQSSARPLSMLLVMLMCPPWWNLARPRAEDLSPLRLKMKGMDAAFHSQ